MHTPALLEYCKLGRHSEGCTIKPYMKDIDIAEVLKPMQDKYSGQKLINSPEILKITQDIHFCAFCVLEKHV